jgi:hypothetical protein
VRVTGATICSRDDCWEALSVTVTCSVSDVFGECAFGGAEPGNLQRADLQRV